MRELKHLLSRHKAERIQNDREQEVFVFAMLLVYLLLGYIMLNVFPDHFIRIDILEDLVSLAMIITGGFLAYSADKLANSIKTK